MWFTFIWTSCRKPHHTQVCILPQTASQAKGGCYLCHTTGKCYNLLSRLQILVEAAIVRWCEKLGSKKADHQITKLSSVNICWYYGRKSGTQANVILKPNLYVCKTAKLIPKWEKLIPTLKKKRIVQYWSLK